MTLKNNPEALNAIGFAERVLALLDQGTFTSTYKYAVLLALMDVTLEQTSNKGIPPETITTRQLAEKVISIYWSQTSPFDGNDRILRQNTGVANNQAEIIRAISEFRSQSKLGPLVSLNSARHSSGNEYLKLVDFVEWKLIEMPLPRLQYFGSTERRFIYDIDWDRDIKKKTVSDYQQEKSSAFNNMVYLKENVGNYFMSLNGLLRPLIQREWSVKVAQLNNLEEARLQGFLFGVMRAGASQLCGPLCETQDGRCFYCEGAFKSVSDLKPEVDHFIPWARYPNDTLCNFVAAHSKCNRDKRDFLAAAEHLIKWSERYRVGSSLMSDLKNISDKYGWELGDRLSLSVTSAIYMHLTPDVEVWKRGKEFDVIDREQITGVLQ